MPQHRKNPFIADKLDHEKSTGRAYRRTVLYARRGCLPKGIKSPQPKADRKGQSQTVRTLRTQYPPKYLLHIAQLSKSSFYYYHQDRPDPDETDKALIAEIYERHKGRYGQRRIAAALGWNHKKAARLMRQLGLKALIRVKKSLPPSRHGRNKGTMLHSDQGVLYRAVGYRELLARHSMVQSMSRKANCWDNAPMESFFAVLKTECFYRAGELTVDGLMKQIDDYIDYYNRERCSLKLKKLSPVAYRTQLAQSA